MGRRRAAVCCLPDRCPRLTVFALDLELDADAIVFTFHHQTQARPHVYSAELIASPHVACLCITTGERFVYKQSFFLSLPADPYQILGPTSSRLANPGKSQHCCVLWSAPVDQNILLVNIPNDSH